MYSHQLTNMHVFGLWKETFARRTCKEKKTPHRAGGFETSSLSFTFSSVLHPPDKTNAPTYPTQLTTSHFWLLASCGLANLLFQEGNPSAYVCSTRVYFFPAFHLIYVSKIFYVWARLLPILFHVCHIY